MKIVRLKKRVIRAEDGQDLVLEYDNMGEPYREGCSMTIGDQRAFLESHKAIELRDLLNEMYPR